MQGGSSIHQIQSSPNAPMIPVEPPGGTGATDNRVGSPALADEVESHPKQTVFQIGPCRNQGFPRPTNLHSRCSHDIKILKSDLDITHPDAMKAASDSPLPSKPFSAWSVTIPDICEFARTFRHCLASIHLRSTSESDSLHPQAAQSSLDSERQAPHSWVQGISTIRRPGIGARGL